MPRGVPNAKSASPSTGSPAQVPTPAPITDESAARVFELETDEDTLTLLHAFNTVGLTATVVYHSGGSKTISV